MNENPEGTPNPLNPAPGTGEELAAGTGSLDFVETANVSEEANEPEVADAPKEASEPEKTNEPIVSEEAEAEEVEISRTPKPESTEEPIKPASFTEAVGAVEAVEETKPFEETIPVSHNVADPMMRPVSHNNFDTLGTDNVPADDAPVEELTMEETMVTRPAPINNAPELVAKDSIVEPAGGGSKKKILAIGAIVLLMIAIICGAAAAAIFLVGKNTDDRVGKAIERLLNGETSSIIAAQGTVDAVSNTDDSGIGDFNLDFNGTFDMRSSMNTISAKINTELAGGIKASISIDELKNEDGEAFFKVRGLDSLLGGAKTTNSEDVTNLTNCINATDTTNCLTVSGTATATDLVSVYSNLIDVIDNQWILVSDDFGDTMGGLGFFDNSSACLANALGTLPQYSKDLAKKYEANQFITYSTDKLEISKKKNELYRLSFDDEKLTAFINSLSNNGFIN